jgi:uncharacterized membrane protein YphA (DoxX/SURF4 family)
MNKNNKEQLLQINIARWLLRIGLAFVYGYASVEIYFNPGNFLKYIPPYMQSIIPLHLFLLLFAVFEIILVIWFLSGKHTEYGAAISALVMVCIIVPNLIFFSVLFRNVAIVFASLALVALDYHHRNKKSNLKKNRR